MYTEKKYEHLFGIKGLSDQILKNHFTLYAGYVKNTNSIIEKLNTLQKAGEMCPEYAELKRRFGWEFGGMRLHELYFENMTKDLLTAESAPTFKNKVTEQFTSLESWKRDFLLTGAMRGIGWVVTTIDTETDFIANVWVNEHDLGHLVGTKPLLVMDVFEHSFVLDYGLDKARYIETFMNAIDWNCVESRILKSN